MPLGTEVGLGLHDIVFDGDPAPSRKFSSLVYCGQTAGWIKMPLGMEVGLGLHDIVFDVDPSVQLPAEKGYPLPIFGPCLL